MPTSHSQGLALKAAAKLAERVPVLRAVPVVRLLMAAEVLVLGKHHLDHLTPQQRGQLVRLVTRAKGRPRNLSAAEQQELADLVALLEPRLFLAEAGDRLSPVGVPGPVRNRLAGTQPVKK